MTFVGYRAISEFGEAAPDTDAARAAERGMCYLRSLFPDAFDLATQFVPGVGLPQPSLNRYMWNHVCDRLSDQNRPSSSEYFYGGQCPVMYFVVGELFYSDRPGNSGTALLSVQGPIETCYWTKSYNSTSNNYDWILTVRGAGGDNILAGMGSLPPDRANTGIPKITIRRADGQPDNCGNQSVPPPTLPPLYQPSVDLDVEIFGQRRPVTFNFPRIDLRDPANIIFEPVVEFEGITVTFAPDGVDIQWPQNVTLPDFPVPPGMGNVINNINSNTNDTVNNISEVINNQLEEIRNQNEIDIQEILDAIEKCCCNRDRTYNTQTIASSTPGGTYQLPLRTRAVVFFIDGLATEETPIQIGSGDAPNVFHWGSYSVGLYGNPTGDRVPLQWGVQSVVVPELGSDVTLWPTYGNRGNIVAVVEEEPT